MLQQLYHIERRAEKRTMKILKNVSIIPVKLEIKIKPEKDVTELQCSAFNS